MEEKEIREELHETKTRINKLIEIFDKREKAETKKEEMIKQLREMEDGLKKARDALQTMRDLIGMPRTPPKKYTPHTYGGRGI